MIKTHSLGTTCIALILGIFPTLLRAEADNSYAIVVSKTTNANADWRTVVDSLVESHKAKVIVYDGAVTNCTADLAKLLPRYACFVAKPAEAGRQFVADVHRLTRTLNDDPYTDVIWGIVTGHSAADALRIAKNSAPLVIKNGGAGTGLNLDLFTTGKWFSEGAAGEYWTKEANGKPTKQTGPADSTKSIVEFLNNDHPDIFMTSGHASEANWAIGYSYPNGYLQSHAGKLVGQDLQHHIYPVDSTNPKVLLSVGNCLMGHINGPDCMALAWMGSAGVDQLVGYTVVTWYGAMGWGVKDYLTENPGRYSVAESFYFSNQHLLYRLNSQFPKAAKATVNIDGENINKFAQELMQQSGQIPPDQQKDCIGLSWDRDVVALYGDPAWDARLAPSGPHITTTLTQPKPHEYHFAVTTDAATKPGKPLSMLLPERLKNIEVTSGQTLEPLVTSNFIMLFKVGDLEIGQTKEVVFHADLLSSGSK